jgi:hypothetical protein
MTKTTSPSGRTRRTPINGRNVLTVTGKEAGYKYRVVNDAGDRIAQFLEAGYELVDADKVQVGDRRITSTTPEGSKAQVSVGNGEKAFVLRIREDWYKEDQASKQAEVSKLEQSITRNLTGKADYGSVQIEQGT